ncbi:PREDICTED: endothelin-converting enzyme 1-like [Dinoponera quadriceps]|uniref:Endothelin-converting enzyme 1-like n=1 Tax=Dinoponera quadriceps TaxID=609295 RepID=A0A6P3WSD4_DINQU|nr:PREDICTED: endothelin-converting enzyme 1-like [Dinoponera quadriceps]
MNLSPLLFCVIVAGAAGLPNRRSTDQIVCETDACRLVGRSIQRSIDKSVDPCTNFYGYGCGLWPKENPLPSTDVEWSTMHLIDLRTSLRLKEILVTESEYDSLEPIKKLKQYYRSCMDEDAIEKRGLEPIQSMVDANGGWPIQSGYQESNNYTWQEIDNNYMQMFLTSSFFQFDFVPDEEDATKFILKVSQTIISFLEHEIVKSSERLFYVSDINRMSYVLVAFKKHKGIEIVTENFTADVMELLSFQEDLKNISEYEEETHKGMKKVWDKMTIAELQEYYDQTGIQHPTAQINWLHKIQELLKPVNKVIDASYPVLVENKHLFHKLAHLLDATPSHVIVSYIQWNLISQSLPYLDKRMRDIEFESSYLGYKNVTEQKPRWKTCIADIPLQDALSVLFVKKYHSLETVMAVHDMLNDLKIEMKERILNSEWTNDNAKNFMIDKIDNIVSLIGYPSWYRTNETALIERYEGLEIGENYFKNRIASLIYENHRELMDYQESPIDRLKWRVSSLSINAFYSPQMNTIIIPAAEIQDPFFTPGMPLAVNYGAMGMIVGHELAHSFDTTGIEYDKFGNKITSDAETTEAYDERVKCFIDQYSNFTLVAEDKDGESVQLNGLFTKDENVADNIGVEIAFAAFQKRKLLTGPQPKLPGLTDVSDEQLFFLSFANTWCMTTTEKYVRASANSDDHSPNKFRILGTVANMATFSNVFNCPVHSPLNSDSKCTLWK